MDWLRVWHFHFEIKNWSNKSRDLGVSRGSTRFSQLSRRFYPSLPVSFTIRFRFHHAFFEGFWTRPFFSFEISIRSSLCYILRRFLFKIDMSTCRSVQEAANRLDHFLARFITTRTLLFSRWPACLPLTILSSASNRSAFGLSLLPFKRCLLNLIFWLFLFYSLTRDWVHFLWTNFI